ncbi:uncharacterized protein LOC123015968 [Tribolium madens]|uniref:uncharacterized protein LOC123015968 n=1 Tax=Tribolium madens TaxID=41895 RepID=UPI001CF74829|nr:uncharacterized protein LOC123015968 [Tribolium madens]
MSRLSSRTKRLLHLLNLPQHESTKGLNIGEMQTALSEKEKLLSNYTRTEKEKLLPKYTRREKRKANDFYEPFEDSGDEFIPSDEDSSDSEYGCSQRKKKTISEFNDLQTSDEKVTNGDKIRLDSKDLKCEKRQENLNMDLEKGVAIFSL